MVSIISPDGNYLSLAIGRSLPVIFGTIAIPLGYGCAKWIWGKDQEKLAQFTALLMAISPMESSLVKKLAIILLLLFGA
ncbi:hypothetical protein NON20_22955 [Synechocystis sp. B12]|nr:hypothetical protein NON20_22955 [Synechocystis sp. B12]